MIVIATAAACVAAGSATADPSLSSKQAQARQVMAQLQRLDGSVQRAQNAYLASSARLQQIERSLRVNRQALGVARVNLGKAQVALAQRLVAIYTTRDDQSTLAVMLGAQSIDDLVNRIETVHSVSTQDVAIMNQVISYKHQISTHEKVLERAHRLQATLVKTRRAAKNRMVAQRDHEQRLYNSIKGEIDKIVAAQQARQLALRREAQARLAASQTFADTAIGASASIPGGTSVAPPSQYGGVVGIALSQLGKPYEWGAAGPDAYDCSGLVAWAYAQVGVSLPHYSGAQWNVGVPVDRADLQPGDLVFFDGLGHVGIYIGNGQFVHAPHTGDVVRISSLSEGGYASGYVGARRIVSGG